MPRWAPQRITLADGKPIDVKLPKGVEDGMQIRLAGKGEQGPGGAGDAIITIAIRPTPSSAAMATTFARSAHRWTRR
jgi:DnaJ-class molecular chaperone